KSVDEPSAVEPVANEPVAEEPVAEKSIAEEPVAEEPVGEQPVAEAPLAGIERLSEEQILAAFAPVEEAPAVEDASSHDEQVEVKTDVVAAEPEPWNAPPVMPPAPEAPVVVHPPVTAAELPPAPSDEPQVPFWKKDISLGGKKREKKTKVDALPSDESNVPF